MAWVSNSELSRWFHFQSLENRISLRQPSDWRVWSYFGAQFVRTVLQKKAPPRIWGKKSEVQTGSNAMNILIRLSEIFVATTKHLTNVRLLWPLQTISQLQPFKKGHLGHRFHQLWNWSHLWLVSTTDLKAPLVCSLEHNTHWTWCKRRQKRLQPHRRVVWIIEPPNSEICNVTGWKQIGAIFSSWQAHGSF